MGTKAAPPQGYDTMYLYASQTGVPVNSIRVVENLGLQGYIS
jgi:hypothetical protein